MKNCFAHIKIYPNTPNPFIAIKYKIKICENIKNIEKQIENFIKAEKKYNLSCFNLKFEKIPNLNFEKPNKYFLFILKSPKTEIIYFIIEVTLCSYINKLPEFKGY